MNEIRRRVHVLYDFRGCGEAGGTHGSKLRDEVEKNDMNTSSTVNGAMFGISNNDDEHR